MVKTGVKLQSIYLYRQGRVPVNRHWTEGTTALNCKRRVRKIFGNIGTVKQRSQKLIALAAHLNRIYRKFFRVYLRDKEGHPSKQKQRSITRIANIQEKYNFVIFYLSQSNLKFSQTQRRHSTTITQSNLYKVNSSRYYKCKGLFTEEFQSILELKNHQIPKVKTGLANHCNNNWRHLSNSGQSTTSFSTQ